ncbi:MAG: 3-dehydroquinate synthase [Candidatus Omnitrophota bacterium]|nr:3-dehydroquinate synthase [Candidatus Omnitrophota bacterium]
MPVVKFKMNPTIVSLGDRSYKILIENSLKMLPRKLKSLNLGTDAVLITNPKINSLFGKSVRYYLKGSGLRVSPVLVPDSERAKSVKEAVKLLGAISKIDGKGKRLCVIALGGGVVGDLAGFVASIYKRGIPYIQIPTTLLAQVDSSIGGKVAIDLTTGKNLTGSFYQPRLVYIDISFIKGLSRRDFISGMAEIIKYGVIKDKALFNYLRDNRSAILRRETKALKEIIARCAKIKADIVSKDERERKSIRTILNFGHTAGHAIETAFGYSGFYSHGEAVGLGMIVAARISNRMGHLSVADLLKIEEMIGSFGLPTKIKRVDTRKIMRSLAYDKKFIHGITRFVLPVRVGRVIIKERISEEMIRQELNRLSLKTTPADDR